MRKYYYSTVHVGPMNTHNNFNIIILFYFKFKFIININIPKYLFILIENLFEIFVLKIRHESRITPMRHVKLKAGNDATIDFFELGLNNNIEILFRCASRQLIPLG